MPGENDLSDEYRLLKYMRSNASTYINQRPIIKKGHESQLGQGN
jgi:DNA-directed RNA polymerase beta subunit